ncbi:MAG: serine/threonine-protein kinase [Nocardioidaceae bacterium]
MSTPARLGRYSVRRRIGSGGFATVWLAYDEQLDSPVAVKVLADNWTEDHHVRQRFLEEGRFLRKVDSPHVVPVYDAGELEDGRPFLVMAYADQGNLADRLAVGPLGMGQALSVVRQVGSGLQALHRRDVLHRDLKPANVLFRTVGPDGADGLDGAPDPADGPLVRAMVGDLGLGKALDMSSRLTMIGGTPSYVSPEQAQGERLDSRSDEYSLGVLAYQLLAGHAPYSHASLAAAAEPGPPPPMGSHVPRDVEEVVVRALARDPDDRWPSVGAFLSALRAAAGAHLAAADSVPETWIPTDPDLTQPAPRPSPLTVPRGREPQPTPVPPRRRRRVLGLAAAVAALAVGAGAGWLLFPRTQPTVTISDGTLSVSVPRAWSDHQDSGTWVPPHSDTDYLALSAGASDDWNADGSDAAGVFVGLMPGGEIPEQMPGHPECGPASEPNESTVGGDAAVTVAYSSCPGGVTIERVVQVSKSQLLWVQVRSSDRGTANEVLDAVDVSGM